MCLQQHTNWLVNTHDRSEEPGGAGNQVSKDELKSCVVGLGEYVECLCQSSQLLLAQQQRAKGTHGKNAVRGCTDRPASYITSDSHTHFCSSEERILNGFNVFQLSDLSTCTGRGSESGSVGKWHGTINGTWTDKHHTYFYFCKIIKK